MQNLKLNMQDGDSSQNGSEDLAALRITAGRWCIGAEDFAVQPHKPGI